MIRKSPIENLADLKSNPDLEVRQYVLSGEFAFVCENGPGKTTSFSLPHLLPQHTYNLAKFYGPVSF